MKIANHTAKKAFIRKVMAQVDALSVQTEQPLAQEEFEAERDTAVLALQEMIDILEADEATSAAVRALTWKMM